MCNKSESRCVWLCVLPCWHVRARSVLCFLETSGSIALFLLLKLADWWCKCDLLVMSQKQAAWGRSFVPVFGGHWSCFSFCFTEFLPSCFLVTLQCPFSATAPLQHSLSTEADTKSHKRLISEVLLSVSFLLITVKRKSWSRFKREDVKRETKM